MLRVPGLDVAPPARLPSITDPRRLARPAVRGGAPRHADRGARVPCFAELDAHAERPTRKRALLIHPRRRASARAPPRRRAPAPGRRRAAPRSHLRGLPRLPRPAVRTTNRRQSRRARPAMERVFDDLEAAGVERATISTSPGTSPSRASARSRERLLHLRDGRLRERSATGAPKASPRTAPPTPASQRHRQRHLRGPALLDGQRRSGIGVQRRRRAIRCRSGTAPRTANFVCTDADLGPRARTPPGSCSTATASSARRRR
jgi:hypothetical protein